MMPPSDLNWQMTGLYLLALALLGFMMKLVALLLPVTASNERAGVFWLLLSPNSLRRLRPAVDRWRVLLQAMLWSVAVLLSYWIYWRLVGVLHVRGLLLSYAALPILMVMSEFLVALVTVLWLPSGQLLPPIHCRLLFTRGVADFWGNRWNLWFSDWFRYAMFARLRRRPVCALILVFAVSGVMHEWVINVPLYYLTGTALFGSMMVYFLLQAAGILLERRFLKSRDRLRVGFAWLVILAPAPFVMNEGLLRTLHLWPEPVSVVRIIVEPTSVEAANIVSPTNAAFAEHVAQLKQKVPEGFTIVAQPPFVVIGDEPPAQVRQRATNTVKWAVDKLKQDYFTRDPVERIDIWLFRDHASYTNHARLLFNDTPTTPFGYYSAAHRALVMNIATGGGTLVHEIVHPFMRANFPDCPAWFNEGLASLYEQSAEKQGHIRGLINWRFKGLERAIKEGKIISFQQLTAMSDAEFYGGADNPNYSEHYGQARYLCYYLQEKGLLTQFYHEFVANAKGDPTGFNTLKRVLGEDDMTAFQKKWEKFVLELRTGSE